MRSRSDNTCLADIHTMVHVWTMHGQLRLYSNGETDLITKS